MECLLPYLNMVTIPHIMVGLERMLDYRGVGLERFHCTNPQSYHSHHTLVYQLSRCNPPDKGPTWFYHSPINVFPCCV